MEDLVSGGARGLVTNLSNTIALISSLAVCITSLNYQLMGDTCICLQVDGIEHLIVTLLSRQYWPHQLLCRP